MTNSVTIGKRLVSPDAPCFIIAEAGVNHNGDIRMARQLVEAAAEAKADAVKFQTFRAATLTTPTAAKAAYQREATGDEQTQQEMLRSLELSEEAHVELKALCEKLGILFLSSPFDEASADFLVDLGVPALKIPSGEITNFPFLQHVAGLGLPLIMSSGMANLSEVAEAMETVVAAGAPPVVLLHCVSNYPARPEWCNLRAMATMNTAFQVPVGFSDHTLGTEVSLAAVALGAVVIEKHFTLDKNLPGPDHKASLSPEELCDFVQRIRRVEASLGNGRKEPVVSEKDTASVARKSLIIENDIPAGVRLSREMIALRRPGTGIGSKHLLAVVGRVTRRSLPSGHIMQWDDLQ